MSDKKGSFFDYTQGTGNQAPLTLLQAQADIQDHSPHYIDNPPHPIR